VIAVVPVRDGVAPNGAVAAIALAGGRAIMVGSGTRDAVAALEGVLVEASVLEMAELGPARLAATLSPRLIEVDLVVVPASPDGRDLAPRLAHILNRELITGVIRLRNDTATVARHDGRVVEHITIDGPAIITVVPGTVSAPTRPDDQVPVLTEIEPDSSPTSAAPDPDFVELMPADPATMDLAEARRIMGGGAGLGSAEHLRLLETVALALGASTGATRVVTDKGWMPLDRQIGTTGVAVDPDLYMAFGVSGAVQHISGLGTPDHIVAVNTDPSSPMMNMADLAIVADGPAVLAALASRLDLSTGTVEPQAVEPQAVEPQAVEPETVEPQAVKPDAVKLEEGGPAGE